MCQYVVYVAHLFEVTCILLFQKYFYVFLIYVVRATITVTAFRVGVMRC